MRNLCIQNLIEIKNLLNQINNYQYSHASSILSVASMGQHVRHILEFYICLLNGTKTGIVNYDKRERDSRIESNINYTIQVIQEIIERLSAIISNDKINLEGNYSLNEQISNRTDSSIYRELVYNLEHSIHHQALIKVGLNEQEIGYLIGENFGVAPATIRYNAANIE